MAEEKPRAKRPDFEIHEAKKRRMQRRVAIILLFVGAIYFFFVVPDELIVLVIKDAEYMTKTFVRIGGSIGITPAFAYVLFVTDSAFRGRNKTAKWVQSLYPSTSAKAKFECNKHDASELWFKYFDAWSLPTSPHRLLLSNSYAATYGARMMFYLERALYGFFALSGLTIVINFLVFDLYTGTRAPLVIHLTITLLFILTGLFFHVTNRPGVDGAEPSGCWQRVDEIFGRSRSAFETDVLAASKTVEEAHARILELKRAWSSISEPPTPEKQPRDDSDATPPGDKGPGRRPEAGTPSRHGSRNRHRSLP